ncbi:hypothetical protein NKH52_28525 [Mesorhizobium sp. M1066]|uniref:hypothetical protein n=1 Tax=unclassified Mesorhizobium TaxID=325217 RepID=UPI003334BD37
MDSLAAARPQIIGFLDTMRDMLEDLGGDLGVTDPVSGTSSKSGPEVAQLQVWRAPLE